MGKGLTKLQIDAINEICEHNRQVREAEKMIELQKYMKNEDRGSSDS